MQLSLRVIDQLYSFRANNPHYLDDQFDLGAFQICGRSLR